MNDAASGLAREDIGDPLWSITQTDFAGAALKASEGLFAQGSGALHVRGSLEEPVASAPQNLRYWRLPANVTAEAFRESRSKVGTFVPGIYGSHPLLRNELVNLPCFTRLTPIAAGRALDIERADVRDHRRTLDLRTGALVRTLRWRVGGVVVDLRFERIVSLARPRVVAQRLTLSSDGPIDCVVRAEIDADVTTNGFDHFAAVSFEGEGRRQAAAVETDMGDRVRIVAETRATGEGPAGVERSTEGRRASLDLAARVRPGEPFVVERVAAVGTSREEDGLSGADSVLSAASETGYSALAAESADAWAGRWARCDVRVEGDEHAQRSLRASIYHLIRAHPGEDDRVAIDAKGYAGEAYWGRFFWDTEMYLLPFYLYTEPERGRSLADFRVRSLGGARRNAAALGMSGVKFAWESDPAGDECCPNWQYGDHEVHVSADVVYGIAHADAAIPGNDALAGRASELAYGVARYWMDRVSWRPGEETPSILSVMGPDEYQPLDDNNAFTNRLAAFALGEAARAAEARGEAAGERGAWREVAGTLPIPRLGELVLQSDGFDRLPAADFEGRWRDRSRPFASQVPQEYLYRTRCLKQADVLMLMWLFQGEFTEAERRAAWAYYVPITTHDSSLSASVHCLVACRLGLRSEAERFWRSSCDIDLRGGAAEGIHIAACAATWQMAVLGFGGMRRATETERLTIDPSLPDGWESLSFRVVWRGHPAAVRIDRAEIEVRSGSAEAFEAEIEGRLVEVGPGGAVTVSRRGAGGAA